MATQHIEITGTSSRLASKTRQLIDQLRQVQELAAEVNDINQQVASGGDFTALGGQLGVTAGNAEIVYNLIVAVQTPLNTSDVNSVIDRLG